MQAHHPTLPAPAPEPRVIRVEGGRRVEGLGAGDSVYHPGLLDPAEAQAMLGRLLPGGEVSYQQWFHMPDAKHPRRPLRPLSRVKVAMATPPEDGSDRVPHYRFPVNNQHSHGVQVPMSPAVDEIRRRVEAATGERFNHAVVLVYRDGGDAIGFHKDKVLDLDEHGPIASVSLGAVRSLLIQDDHFKPSLRYEVPLEAGALFVLGPRTNQGFYHSIPRLDDASAVGPRVSLTFRRAMTFRDAEGRLHGQGARYGSLNWPVELQGAHRLDEPTPARGF